ncbi:MAG: hypothetical protein ABI681_05750 [Gemmatimonadales bacterium]
MAHPHFTVSTILFVAMLAAPANAQTPTDSAAKDSVAPTTGRMRGMFNKAKKVAGNKTVQAAAKGVACTVVPGAAVVTATTGSGPCVNSGVAGLMSGATGPGGIKGALTGAATGAAAGAMGNSSAAAMLTGANAANAQAAMAAAAMGGLSNKAASAQAIAAAAAMNGLSNAAAAAAMQGMMQNAGAAPGKPSKNLKAASTGTPAPSVAPPTLKTNSEFVPGDRALFDINYGDDQIGNFPKRLNFVEGNMEVVELGGMRLLRATTASILTISLPEVLPQRFTIEIDVINRPSLDSWTFQLRGGTPKPVADPKSSAVTWGSDGVGVLGGGGGEVKLVNDDANRARYRGKPAQLRILGDGKYLKVYLDERRLANIPNAEFERSKTLTLRIEARSETNPAFVGHIRVAAVTK